tara:strand:+ start:5255 stop:6049 length:795 start_codon:yes stop_codon:yes gene_type:complete
MIDIIHSDILKAGLEKGKYRSCVTSPPYFGMRSYGEDEKEIGKDETLDEYIAGLVEVFSKVRECLTDDGTLWLNVGDSYNGSGGAGSDYKEGGRKAGKNKWGSRNVSGLAPKNLIGVAWRLALALQADGWILRSEIIWSKTKSYPQPEAYIKRPIPKHETIFMFSKNPDYHYNATNSFTVWEMSPVSKTTHEAPFPVELPERCIIASTDEGDWVIDPFGGSGTTGVAAHFLNRNATMVELYESSCESMRKRFDDMPATKGIEWV